MGGSRNWPTEYGEEPQGIAGQLGAHATNQRNRGGTARYRRSTGGSRNQPTEYGWNRKVRPVEGRLTQPANGIRGGTTRYYQSKGGSCSRPTEYAVEPSKGGSPREYTVQPLATHHYLQCIPAWNHASLHVNRHWCIRARDLYAWQTADAGSSALEKLYIHLCMYNMGHPTA